MISTEHGGVCYLHSLEHVELYDLYDKGNSDRSLKKFVLSEKLWTYFNVRFVDLRELSSSDLFLKKKKKKKRKRKNVTVAVFTQICCVYICRKYDINVNILFRPMYGEFPVEFGKNALLLLSLLCISSIRSSVNTTVHKFTSSNYSASLIEFYQMRATWWVLLNGNRMYK